MKSPASDAPTKLRETRHAFAAVEELLGKSSIARDPAALPVSDFIEDATDPANLYALQFLTYAYTVPFRLVAVQQELSDVFGFSGTFDPEFVERWGSLTPPEQAAFSQAYRELRRMQTLGRAFGAADRADPSESTVEDRAARFVAAHIGGLEDWQELLQRESQEGTKVFGRTATPLTDAMIAPARNAADVRADSALPNPGGTRQFFVADLDAREGNDIASIAQQLAPIDDLARDVLDRITEVEIAEARRRFLTRVRWMLSLPNQQRMAIALRTTGRKRREIAKAMGISEESVKTHLSRADDDWRQKQPETVGGLGKTAKSTGR